MLWLLACSTPDAPERALSLQVEDSGPATVWTEPDTGDGPGLEVVHGSECAGGSHPDGWCVRLSPEPGDGPFADQAPPPCGFYNLIGAVDGSGAAVAWCDSDANGGLRFARVGQSEPIGAQLTERGCWADPDTGTLRPSGAGFELLHLVPGALSNGTLAGIERMVLDEEAHVLDQRFLYFEGRPFRLRPVDEERLVVTDLDGVAYLYELPTQKQARFADDIGTFQPFLHAGDVGLVTCSLSTEALQVVHGGERVTLDGECGWIARPSAASLGSTLAVAWDDGDEGHLVFLSEGGEVARHALAVGATVIADGDRFLAADSEGTILQYSGDGQEQERWHQPSLDPGRGFPMAIKLAVDGDTLLSLAVWRDQDPPTNQGHIYTFHVLEASAMPLP